MLMELNAGRVDALTLPKSVGAYLASTDDKLLMVQQGDLSLHYHMATRADDTHLCEEISQAIDALKADGTLNKLTADYITAAPSEAPTDKILTKKEGVETHIVAVTGDMPPLDYVAADGTPTGFNVALLNAISEKDGCNFEIVQMDAAARLSALESGKVDLVFWIGCWSNESFEPKTDKVYLSTPYFEEERCFVTNDQAKLDQISKDIAKTN